MAERIRLATKADDLGGAHSRNRAIVEAYERGILRNAGLMVPAPAAEEAAEMLAGEKGLCIGLHGTLTAEWDDVRWGPVLPPEQVPSLVQADGTFFQTTQALHAHGAQVEQMLAELQAQLDRAAELGFDLRYIDIHMGAVWIIEDREGPDVFPQWAAERGLVRPYNLKRLEGRPSAPDAASDEAYVRQFIEALDRAEPGDYLVTGHPGYDDEELRACGHDGYPGEAVAISCHRERLMFSHPDIVAHCRQRGIEPMRLDEILK